MCTCVCQRERVKEEDEKTGGRKRGSVTFESEPRSDRVKVWKKI